MKWQEINLIKKIINNKVSRMSIFIISWHGWHNIYNNLCFASARNVRPTLAVSV